MTQSSDASTGPEPRMPAVSDQVLAVWDDCGALTWDMLVDGEMKIIKHYMRENRLPWGFLRLAFGMGAAAYLSVKDDLPEVLPMPYRKNRGDTKSLCEPDTALKRSTKTGNAEMPVLPSEHKGVEDATKVYHRRTIFPSKATGHDPSAGWLMHC